MALAEDESLRLPLALRCSSLSHGYMSASMALAPGLSLSLVPYPSYFRMGLGPLLEAPLSALQLPALPFLVVLAVAAGLRGF